MVHRDRGRCYFIGAAVGAAFLMANCSAPAVGIHDNRPSHFFEESALLKAEDDLDLKAMSLMSDPAVAAARMTGEQALLATLTDPAPETRARFRRAASEITFFGILNGLNDDPLHPRITIVGRPARMVAGKLTLAPKGIDENPDSVYRIIPVDGTSTYAIHGKVSPTRPVVNDFSVLDDAWQTVGNLSGAALKLDADGGFVLTVGPEPAAGRPNHIQTTPGANYMTIRDTIGNWPRERPNQLSVERIAGPPAGPPLSAEQQLRKVVAKVTRYFAESVKMHRRILTRPANDFAQPVISTADGMLITQAYSLGHFQLAKGQALVLTIHPGTAKYVTVPVTNLWGTTMDPVHHASSLNLRDAKRNPDGSFTAIVSPSDPHLENWVDTEGLPEGFLFLRWAAIEGGASATSKPAVESKVVALDDLSKSVPATLGTVDVAARQRLIRQRARDYDRRWAN